LSIEFHVKTIHTRRCNIILQVSGQRVGKDCMADLCENQRWTSTDDSESNTSPSDGIIEDMTICVSTYTLPQNLLNQQMYDHLKQQNFLVVKLN